MGILSAVTVAAPAGILNALLSGDKGSVKERLLGAGPFFVLLASASCILAALFFYKQRSLLAWYYGQMCLTESLGDDSAPARVREYLRGADSWETWIPYSWGFTALVTSFVEYVAAALCVFANRDSLFFKLPHLVGLGFPLAVPIGILQWWVLKHYGFSDQPWKDFSADAYHRLFETVFPHEGVYTRIKGSPISGVGVFAVRPIPKDTYVFEPDDDKLVSVKKQELENLRKAGKLDAALHKLYEDFCVLRGDRYECPSSFNRLTISWYLNHDPEHPNVAADTDLRFYALRDIEADEELTANYNTYSENSLIEDRK